MDKFSDVFKEFFRWLKDVIPSLVSVAFIVKNHMQAKVNKALNAKDKAELKTKFLENKLDVQKENAGLSDSDIIDKYTGGKG